MIQETVHGVTISKRQVGDCTAWWRGGLVEIHGEIVGMLKNDTCQYSEIHTIFGRS